SGSSIGARAARGRGKRRERPSRRKESAAKPCRQNSKAPASSKRRTGRAGCTSAACADPWRRRAGRRPAAGRSAAARGRRRGGRSAAANWSIRKSARPWRRWELGADAREERAGPEHAKIALAQKRERAGVARHEAVNGAVVDFARFAG